MSDKIREKNRYNVKALEQEAVGAYSTIEDIPLYLSAPYKDYEMLFDNSMLGASILELGAGTGEKTEFLLKKGLQVCATDISERSVKVLRKRFSCNKLFSAELADMESLPFNNSSYDVVCCAGSLSYGDNCLVMSEILRVLKPSGKLILVDSLHNNPIYVVNRWIAYFFGKRSLSTIKRMPSLKLLDLYKKSFNLKYLKFYGSITWLMPFLKLFLGELRAAAFSDTFDRLVNVKRSAFKFVAVLEKKIIIR